MIIATNNHNSKSNEGANVRCAIFTSETNPTPRKTISAPWQRLTPLWAAKTVRPTKEGAHMFGPYALRDAGRRCNKDVEAITMLVVDSDHGVPFDEVVARFSGLAGLAYTTHSHTPEKPKCRAVLPLATPVQAPDYPAFIEGAKDRFGFDIFDEQASRNLSQAYYLPTCPPETAAHRRAVEFEGGYLNPLPLIARGVGILAARTLQKGSPDRINDLSPELRQVPLETAEEVERVKSALAAIPADCDREQWMRVCMAVKFTAWNEAESIAEDWSRGAPGAFDQGEFEKLWNSITPDGGITLGTLFHIAKEHGWQDPGPAAANPLASPLQSASGDIANGRVFATMWRTKLLHVHETAQWLEFSQATGWMLAPPGSAERAAKAVVEALRNKAAEMYRTAPEEPRTKRLMAHVERSSSAAKVAAMIEMAKSEEGMTVQLPDLDAHPMLLGVENGVLDLSGGTLLAPAPELRVTKRCAVDYIPGTGAPLWEAFITRISSTPALAGFLQRLAGYLLTGSVAEQCFAFLHGNGRNGKTTYAETLRWLLGDYSVVLPTATLMQSHRDPGAASPDLMLLKGARMALASETEEDCRLAESMVKMLTGGDSITARNPYGTFATWSPTHKIMVYGNHRPVITGGDHGIWRRVRLVPFTAEISDAECDPGLPDKLKAEGPGILNWCLEGLRAWRREGLNPPPEVRGAVEGYRKDMDIIGEWLDDHTVMDPTATTPTAELHKAYSAWARQSGRRPMTRQTFGRRLGERGFPIGKAGASSIRCATGLRLNDAAKAAADAFHE